MSATLREAIQMFLDSPVRYIYIVDEENRYQGVIDQQSLTRLLIQHPEAQDEPLGEQMKIDSIEPLTSAMSLDEAQGLLDRKSVVEGKREEGGGGRVRPGRRWVQRSAAGGEGG